MTLIKFYNPVQTTYQNEDGSNAFEQLTRNFLPESVFSGSKKNLPYANITENDDAYNIEMALPGVNKKDIKIDHDDGYLTVKVESEKNKGDVQSNYAIREFDYDHASRTFRIGRKIEINKIKASYNNGLLVLVLPKKEEFVHKPARSITVE